MQNKHQSVGSKDTYFSKKKLLNCGGKLLDLSIPKIIGILNVTPDSFYDGGQYTTKETILQRVGEMLSEGADIIDVGAYSSRPGAEHIGEKEEMARIDKALSAIRNNFTDILISVDTFRSSVARFAIENFKVNIINDISSGELEDNMFSIVAQKNIPYIMMHMQGKPQNMQENPQYDNLLKEIMLFFARKLQFLKQQGVNDIIIDPGFGFGKTIEHNYYLLKNLDQFKIFNLPVLVGISRKSMIYKVLHGTPQESLNGTTALHMAALLNGANLLRVHDVKQAKETIELFKQYQRA